MSNWTGRPALFVAVVLVSAFALVHWAQSCADPGDPFDDYSIHPDIPLARYSEGTLGIVRPTFARSYLVLAYRYLSGAPLTKNEQEAAQALWENRGIEARQIYPEYFSGNGGAENRANPYVQVPRDLSDGPNDWATERAQVTSAPPTRIAQMQGLDTYNEYLNCANDAFATAAATLKQRAARFGKDHPGVQAWVTAQDAVFINCGGKPEEPVLPSLVDPSLPEIFHFDREYQIAAAYMYSNHRDQAVKLFQRIATESDSPWHGLAPYLVARTMVRGATLEAAGPDFDETGMQEAAGYIRKLLAEQPNRPFADALRSLLDRVEFRLHPVEQTVRLSEALRKPAPDGRFYDWLCDYTWLLDRRGDAKGVYGSGPSPDEYNKRSPDRAKDDLTDWVLTFQSEDPLAAQHAFAMWQAHPDSKPWLIAVLATTQPNSPHVDEVLAAARKIPQTSPAFISAFYHRMRIEGARHNDKEVRESIDTLLHASPKDLQSVARESLLDLRLDSASNLDDAVRFIPRSSCEVTHSPDSGNCPKTLTDHGARFLNGLPLDTLNGLLERQAFPEEVSDKFARNVFMRAVVLERHDIAQPLAKRLFSNPNYQFPVPAEQIRNLVVDYQSASATDEKQFAAVFLLQHLYAFGYEIGAEQPWCASGVAFHEQQQYNRWAPGQTTAVGIPALLSPEQHRQVETEQASLEQSDSQANYYAKSVLEFAAQHPDDPRVPEALSRAVKNTRMNCNNARTGALSKKAFDLLHSRYSDTAWAKNTKYWYGSDQ